MSFFGGVIHNRLALYSQRSQEIVDALITSHKPVSYLDVDAEQGHDSFLFPIPLYVKTLRAFLGGQKHLEATPQETV